jgi:hypothetical protein
MIEGLTPSALKEAGEIWKPSADSSPAPCSAITPEIGEACARLLLSDGRLIEIVDSYNNGRLILSAIYNRYGCKYQNNRKAQHDLLVALGHESWAGKSPNESSSPTAGGGSGGAQPKGTNEK